MDRTCSASRALGEALRSFRVQRGFSQEKLGELAGVDRTYVGGVERGERNPTLCVVARVLRALGVSWEALGERMDREVGEG